MSKRDKAKRPRFRTHAAVPSAMGRNIGFKELDRVSLATQEDRVVVPSVMGAAQAERLGFAKGQCDLIRRSDGKWFLLVTASHAGRSPLSVSSRSAQAAHSGGSGGSGSRV